MKLSTAGVLITMIAAIAAQTPSRAQSPISSLTTPHPRLWVTPARIARMRADEAGNTPRWQNLLSAANAALATTGDTNPDDIPPLALVYLVQDKKQYGQAAIAIMLLNAVASNTLTDDDEYDYRNVLPDMSAGFDWCYPLLTTAQRHQIATWMMDRADFVWPDTNPSRVGAWGVADPADNYFIGFLTTWSAAIAAYGDDTGVGTVSGSNRPLYHINLGLKKYNTMVLPWAGSWGVGGVYAESTNYDLLSVFRLALILDGHETGTGQELINASAPGSDFLRESLYWNLYSTVPNLDQYYPLGDQSRQSMPDLVDYNRMRAYVAASDTNAATAAAYTKYWLDTINPNIGQWSFTAAWEFLYYNAGAPSKNYTTALPLYYYASGPGVLFRRSDWSTGATFYGIWSGPDREGHQDGDVNGFLIYKGGWLAANANIYSQSGILQDTFDYNDITFGPQPLEQTWQVPDAQWPKDAGQMTALDNAPEFSYFAGEAAQAYVQDRSHAGTPVATDFTRKFIYIAPDTFLDYDRVTLIDPGLSKDWHLHSPNPITISGRTYHFDNGVYRLFGQSLLPSTGVTLKTVDEDFGSTSAPSSYRLDVSTSNDTATDRMLNVFQIAPVTTQTAPAPVLVSTTTGNMDGAMVSGWVVLVGRTEPITSSVAYSIDTTSSTQHLLVDLVPKTDYIVTAGSTIQHVTTDTAGSLRFTLKPGHETITVERAH